MSRTLYEKMQNNEKVLLDKMKSELKYEYENKMRKMENTLNA